MRTGFKILISLLISVATFIGLIYLSVSGYESLIETKLYQPAIVKQISNNLSKISSETNKWHKKNKEVFSEILREKSIKSSFLQKQEKTLIEERDKLLKDLTAKTSGLMGLCVVEDKTRKIHFSTKKEHILNKSKTLLSYKKYNKANEEIALKYIASQADQKVKITADDNVFIYAFPFYDNYNVCRGTAVFYVSKVGLLNFLSAKKIIALSDDINLISDDNHKLLGVLTGLPSIMTQDLKREILN